MTIINSRKKKRSKEAIIASILLTARNGASKTKISYVSFLNSNVLRKYLNFALDSNLIEKDHTGRRYVITNQGTEFLRCYQELYDTENHIYEKQRMLNRLLERKEKVC